MKAARWLCLTLLLTGTATAWQQPKSARPPAGAYEISGRVISALTSEPLAGVTVNLSVSQDQSRPRILNRNADASRASEIAPVTTGADGSFIFSGLRPGKYSLSATKRGFGQQLYEQHEQFSSAIVVGPDKDSANVIFRLKPDASIGGRIVDEHNEPVANAQLILFREGVQNGRHGIYRTQATQSSDEGVYRFGHIWPGKFYIAVSATPWYAQFNGGMRGRMNPGWIDAGGAPPARQVDDGSAALDVCYPLTFYPGVTDSARAEALDLKPGQRETVDFTLVAIPSLHVRVNGGSSEPGRFVTAMLTQEVFDSGDIGVRGRSMTFGQGVTEISGIAPGHYTLHLNTNGPNRSAPTVLRDLYIASSTEIDATDIPPSVNVTGTLRFEGSPPSEPLRLMLRRRTAIGGGLPLQVNTKGEISNDLPIQPDTYDLSLPMNGYQITQIAVSGAKLKGQSIQIGSNDVKLTLVAAKSSARVEGVAWKDGKPQPGVMIVLVPEDMERPLLYRRDQSDSDGSFVLSAVAPGKYTLIALQDGWDMQWSKPEVIKPYFAAGTTIQVAVDGTYKQDVTVQ